MSKSIIKALGILLSVCFLMSVTAAAWSSESNAAGVGSKELMKDKMLGKTSEEKGLSACKNIFIRNVIIAKNIIIIKARAHPLLRAMLLKRMMTNEGMMKNNEMMENEGMMSGSGASEQSTSCSAARTASMGY